jgi:capsular exopolysaccharide synthesis family protein
VLAMVPRIKGKWSSAERGQLVQLDSRSPAAEAYRAIRTALHLGARQDCRTVLVTSATAGDGKSTTASNLAIACAQAGERTLLVDCDLRRPVQDRIFDVNGSRGITGVLAGRSRLGEAIRAAVTPNLYVLPCGDLPADPSALLAGKGFTRLMQRLAATFDRVIIDSPPVMTVTDAHILAANADVTLLVLRLNRSTRDLVRNSCDALDRIGASVLGVVANDVPSAMAHRYYGGLWHDGADGRRKALEAPVGPSESAEPEAATDSLGGMEEDEADEPMPWEVRVGK